MASNQLKSGAQIVQFPKPPLYGDGEPQELFQVTGYDTAGSQYVYDKGWIARTHHNPTYPDVPGSIVAAARTFLSTTVRGNYQTFTWYDHNAIARTVRLNGKMDIVPTGPDGFRISLPLEEDTTWSPPAIAGTIDDKLAGPLWFLKWTVNGVTYYPADGTVTITPWGVTTVPWVTAWGKIRRGISGALGEYQVANFDCTLSYDPAATPNPDGLVTQYPVEGTTIELWVWSVGTNDIRLEFSGNVADVNVPTPGTVDLKIKDGSDKLKSYIGEKVSLASWPDADPADVGQVIQIPFGESPKVPALGLAVGAKTTLKSAAAIGATYVTVSDATGIAVGSTILIDTEQKVVSSVSGQSIGVPALTAAHTQGTAVVELVTLHYCPSWRAVSAINKVWLRKDGLDLDITAYCTRYIGHPGSQLTGYGSMAMVTISPANFAAIAGLSAQVQVTDSIGVGSSNLSITEATTNTPISNQMTTSGYQVMTGIATFNNTESGNRAAIMLTVSVKFAASASYDASIRLFDNNNSPVVVLWSQNGIVGEKTFTYTFELTSSYLSYNRVGASIGSSNTIISLDLQGATRTIRQTSSSSGSGASVSKSGTVVLSGTVVGEIFGSGKILCDLIADCPEPTAACNWILAQKNYPPVQLSGSLPASYAINGIINEYRTALDILNDFAFQCRSWFCLDRGAPKLIVRPDTLTSTRTIPAIRVINDGTPVRSRRKSDIDDVINTIKILYNRDWTMSGDTAYQGLESDNDPDSIAIYKVKEKPDLFRFDFCRSQAMAASVLAFYLGYHKDRHWIEEIGEYLDQVKAEFGSVVALGFDSNKPGIVMEPQISPGSKTEIDTVTLTVMT
ncbi:MAG: hypothetical protein VB050_03210 [Geobacteraceae bacterium]|nr:hypothetical protein [Geobacteraceae bacterium]